MNLSPKEKVKELVNQIYQPLGKLSCNVSSRKMWEYAKDRAFELVREITDLPVVWYSEELSKRMPEEAPENGTEEYWQKVKVEILNL